MAFGVGASALEVPLRVDLGVETCGLNHPVCSRTPFSGSNILLSLALIKQVPQIWEGEWTGVVSQRGLRFSGLVRLRVEATPSGYLFQLTAKVADSELVLWLDHLGQLKHTELRGQKTNVLDGSVMPYLYLSQPL